MDDDLTKWQVLSIWERLTEDEQKIMGLRLRLPGYIGPLTVGEVCVLLRLSREEVRKVEARVLSLARHPAR
jgi:DNA-directed RNA polymerase sigma subunit (sigma70/sigma32)